MAPALQRLANWAEENLVRIELDLFQEFRPDDKRSHRHHTQRVNELIRDWTRGLVLLGWCSDIDRRELGKISAVLSKLRADVERTWFDQAGREFVEQL